MAPNEYSATKSVTSSKYLNSGVKRKSKGTETVTISNQNDKQKKKSQQALVGTKRPPVIDSRKYYRRIGLNFESPGIIHF
jgi:hypothetical protein